MIPLSPSNRSTDARLRVLLFALAFLSPALLASGAATASSGDCGTGGDAGGSHAAASALTLPVTDCAGATASSSDEDWFRFPVDAGSAIRVFLVPSRYAFLDICLYSPSDAANPVACSAQTFFKTERIVTTATEAGDWRVRVMVDNWEGAYMLSVNPVEPAAHDCGAPGDAGDEFPGARALAPPVLACDARIGYQDGADWYAFQAGAGETIDVTLRYSASVEFDLCLVSPSEETVACSYGSGGEEIIERYTTTAAGTWRVEISPFNGVGPYTLTVLEPGTTPPQNDCGTGGDASASYDGAPSLGLPVVGCAGDLPRADSADRFRVQAFRGQRIVAERVLSGHGSSDVCIEGPSPYWYDRPYACGDEQVEINASRSGSWFVSLFSSHGSLSYTLSVRIEDGPQDDCGLPGDASEVPEGSRAASTSEEGCLAQLRPDDAADWYHLPAERGEEMWAVAEPQEGLATEVCLFAPSAPLIPVSCDTGGVLGGAPAVAIEPGDWLVRVRAASGAGDYELRAVVRPLL